ncbi:hypothetical protein TPHA_0G01630 [Tetrapisispora phaffii CBS 4417]|uniref:non-specific serine/threonine protein kinase n=1 Tax=Tetrapisispora phaffii (strain ATCC 24235 / CBS 4417 / NBRC 1672 / NRRL Y-8282 / UCD 70-5) TaxID=1071381 RepID=G8BVS1_TETPH|nr:hypothetical protein TPHA_0G01630 [Tetrapisispora phaffii CBS 4417]CCE63999.1 hypothetical protein TPHA_0G01630 [Tetrapisispora phaffii CBS 4417]
MRNLKIDDNQLKELINKSYNKLYGQFTSNELYEVGNYKILKQVGEGSFGKVYLAIHRPTHRKVVLKSSSKTDPNVVREVFYHRQFDHPYITKLYEIIITETKVWMSLEYCPGKELYDYLLVMRRIPLDECSRLFAQIVGAVYYAHSLNCVHRDLKLENILLDMQGNAKLADFGFTRECATKNQLETICGTTVYMAPELLRRDTYDGFKIDIWSLGVILYTLINGSMPFDEEDETRTEWKIINEEPDYNEKIFNANSIELIKSLLIKDPKKRPSMTEILKHKFLEPYGESILEEADKILLKQRNSMLNFNTKTEKRLLKMLKRSGFDTQAIKSSVQKRKCDSLSGHWYLLLEQEKESPKLHKSHLNKSILSLTKVFEDADEKNEELIDNLDTNLILSRTTSLHRNTSNGKDTSLSNEESLVGASLEPTITKNSILSSSTFSNDFMNSKNKLFKRMTKFFKSKNNQYFMASADQDSINAGSVGTALSRLSLENKRKRLESTENNIKLEVHKLPEDNPNITNGTKKDSLINKKKEIVIVSNRNSSSRNYGNMSNTKSGNFSEFSDNTSIDNYNDSESLSNMHFSLASNAKVLAPLNSRLATSISQHSQLSNDTYASDYSTDGNNSSSHKQEFTKYRSGKKQNTTSLNRTEKILNVYGRKFVRRDKSIISTTSSTSEISSRADSFYDLATVSLPTPNEKYSSDIPNARKHKLSRFDTKKSWLPGEGHSSRNNVRRRRSAKHNNYKNTVAENQFVIQEESSIDSDENNLQSNNDLLLSPRINLHDSEINSSGNDDDLNYKPFSSKTFLQTNTYGRHETILKHRSLSNDSEWSHRMSNGQDDISSMAVEEDDDGSDVDMSSYNQQIPNNLKFERESL